MAYTVLKLVNDAYYLSGIVARQFQTVDGQQSQDGLDFLNDILTDKYVEEDMIPYFQKYTFSAVAGKETYFIPNLLQLQTLVFYIQDIRYQMNEIPRRQYFGSSRANNIDSLPFTWHAERAKGGSNIYLYFFPNINYPMEAWGLFGLSEVSINQNLESNITTFNLGQPNITGTGTLIPGQFVVNGIDMAGTYATSQALVTAINAIASGGFNASLYLGQVTLNSNVNLVISTTGNASSANTITFVNYDTITQQMSQTYFPMVLDRFYISYLKYSLANRLCIEYDFQVPEGVKIQLLKYEQMIAKRTQKIDLRNEKISTLGQNTSLNYGIINLSNGWTI